MNENEFAVALFALFFTGYVLIKMIFAVPRTSGTLIIADDPEDADIDTTYHYNEDGTYEPDWARFDEDNRS